MYIVRRWSVRHAGLFEWVYSKVAEPMLIAVNPLLSRIGYDRLEAPFSNVERVVKGFFFDCRMCGHCVLSSTGMSCPMNCPKHLRNGPCGGVRANGKCEVSPDMQCVWVDAWAGNSRMHEKEKIHIVQMPPPYRDQGSSSFLRVARVQAEAKAIPSDGAQ